MGKSKEYNKIKLIISIISTIINLFIIFILGFTKIGIGIKNISGNNIFYYGLITIIIFFISEIGFSYYSGYYLEKKNNLSNENPKKWIIKTLKEFGIGLVVGEVLIVSLYFFIKISKDKWWIYFYIFMMSINIILGVIAPTVIMPLFYKFKELENENLKNKILDLTLKAKVKLVGIYKFDLSKETKKANAAFTGLGKNKRIIIADNLLDEFSDDEIVAVFAHEMGHFVKKHILKQVVISSVIMFVLLFFINNYFYLDYNNFIVIYQVGFYFFLFQIFFSFFSNIYSRKNEKEADLYAKEIMGTGEDLIKALKKLSKQNLADENPNKIVEFLTYSHPSISTRINYLK